MTKSGNNSEALNMNSKGQIKKKKNFTQAITGWSPYSGPIKNA